MYERTRTTSVHAVRCDAVGESTRIGTQCIKVRIGLSFMKLRRDKVMRRIDP